jgi:hypothetical protein
MRKERKAKLARQTKQSKLLERKGEKEYKDFPLLSQESEACFEQP